MATLYLSKRLEALRRAQRPDGGWAYQEGKEHSWLEPTVYAALALHGEPEADRAWDLVRRWQKPDGSWQMAANVGDANWTTSLGLLLAAVRGEPADSARQWLTKAVRGRGWAWKDESAPAAEPTGWTVLALARAGEGGPLLDAARAFLLETELAAANCGTTLAALCGSPMARDLSSIAAGWRSTEPSEGTRALLALGLRLAGAEVAETDSAALPRNLAVLGLEALAARDGRFAILKAEAKA